MNYILGINCLRVASDGRKKEGIMNQPLLSEYFQAAFYFCKLMIFMGIRGPQDGVKSPLISLIISLFRVLRLQLLFAKTYQNQKGWQS